MYKITWGMESDKFQTNFILCPDYQSVFNAWWIITGYGRRDRLTPVDVVVSDLEGNVVDMTKGIHSVASYGTCTRLQR
jgi:hypothetical protein